MLTCTEIDTVQPDLYVVKENKNTIYNMIYWYLNLNTFLVLG